MYNKKIQELVNSKKGIYLEIGGGDAPQKGYINMDMRKLPAVDIVHDVEDSRGFPLPDNCVNRLLASHILEHICPKKFLFVMSEIHRVCIDGGQVLISVPYGGSVGSLQDPSHCSFFNENTFYYFDDRSELLWGIYKPPILRVAAQSFDLNGNVEAILEVVKDGKNEKNSKTADSQRKQRKRK